MTPIERVRARFAAAEVLGVTQHADTGEIRTAWQRAARSLHPDRAGGDKNRFVQARAAFECLAGDQDGAKTTRPEIRSKRTTLRRPTVARREMMMDPEDYMNCVEILEDNPERTDADHVPVDIVQTGRSLVFRVSAPLVDGVNRVAVPTGVLQPHLRSKPTILKFRSRKAGAGEIHVPDVLLEQRFPGTRSVKIEFTGA
ncbi:DnaJ domain-containing protein [Aliiruegeria lutimaris]|uniref:DnaJ domain-containing protein n=1 Tax=Aliiruegeria lutimaris TaxID=571298 RepID=A0A1G8LLE9_9RHOB|nr:DnaJ domain-containing protein [Aliiruegeria lutimaris]SDI56498.1 DnaJ domain-containing protein [Aliiruegeria lutimaris]